MRKPAKYYQGISLVELMIAMTIGLVLTLGVTRLLIDSQLTQLTIQENSEAQESGQLLFALLRKDIQMAGYRGCNTAAPLGDDLAEYIDGVSLSPAAADLPANQDANSSKVTFFYLRPYPDAESSEVTVSNNTITLTTTGKTLPLLAENLVIGNCAQQEQISKPVLTTATNTFNVTTGFKGVYEDLSGTAPDEVHLYQMIKRTYSVVNNSDGVRLFLNQSELVKNLISTDDSDSNDVKAEFIFQENLVNNLSTNPASYSLTIGIAGNENGDAAKVFSALIAKRNDI